MSVFGDTPYLSVLGPNAGKYGSEHSEYRHFLCSESNIILTITPEKTNTNINREKDLKILIIWNIRKYRPIHIYKLCTCYLQVTTYLTLYSEFGVVFST